MHMEIDFLNNRLHFLDALIDLLWDEWSSDYMRLTPYKTKELLKSFYRTLTCTSIPTCYVIFEGDTFIGTCLIDNEDMQVHPHLKPWLASVIVVPEYRNKGYAKALLRHVLPQYDVLHLWTFNQILADYYKQFGFLQKEVIPKHGDHDNIIYMRYQRTQ